MMDIGHAVVSALPDTVWREQQVYVLQPTALAAVLDHLRMLGYMAKDRRATKLPNDPPAAELERAGEPMWHASLPRAIRCTHCQALIKARGVETHDHRCEACGEPTYLELTPGSKVLISFRHPNETLLEPRFWLRVARWAYQAGWLYLHPGILGREWQRDGEDVAAVAQAYFAEHGDKWEAVDEQAGTLWRVRYWGTSVADPLAFPEPPATVHLDRCTGEEYHFERLTMWQGRGYKEGESLPVPTSINVYEVWRWAPEVRARRHYVMVGA